MKIGTRKVVASMHMKATANSEKHYCVMMQSHVPLQLKCAHPTGHLQCHMNKPGVNNNQQYGYHMFFLSIGFMVLYFAAQKI